MASTVIGTFFMALHSAQGPQLRLPYGSRPEFGALMVWLFAYVQHDGLSLEGEALHTTVHGGVKVWVGVLAVRRNTAAKEDDAWMSRNSSVPSPSAPD
ncbi:hypothetical protein ACWDR2_39885 [Streptomyces sp. NPDC003631]|uniref:hypothetical protein n=1 Tax=unclassified Streptomyces TaxID=2593676 RepID=UPI00367C5425